MTPPICRSRLGKLCQRFVWLMLLSPALLLNSVAQPLDACLISHWKFDERSGNTALDSVDGNPGTLVNNPAHVVGRYGSSLRFNGVDQYVNIPDSDNLDLSPSFSVSLWFNPSHVLNNTTGRKDLVKKFLAYWMIFDYPANDGRLTFVLNDGSVSVKSTMNSWPANQWYHAVATYDGASLKLYVNSVLEGTTATSLIPNTNTFPLQIGGNTEQLLWFPGSIDEVRFYACALTPQQVADLYAVPPSPANQPPVISAIPGQFTPRNVPTGDIPLTVGDPDQGAAVLTLTGSSSNPLVVPDSGITFGGSGSNRTVKITPAPNQSGHASITLTVSDGSLITNTTFTVDVLENPPTFPNLISHWQFDEPSGDDALDATGRNPGTLVNGPTRDPNGRFGGALRFDGLADYVNVPDSSSLDLTNHFSLSMWFKPDHLLNAASGRRDLLKKFTSYWLVFNYPANDGRLQFILNTGQPRLGSITTSWNSNQWYHVAATYDGANMKLYINGVLEGMTPAIVPPNVTAFPAQIGGNTEQGFWFPGCIDDVQIYGEPLSSAQVQVLVSPPQPPEPPEVIAQQIVILSPPNGTVTNGTLVHVTGLAPINAPINIVGGPTSLIATGGMDGRFETDVPLNTNRRNRLFFTATLPDGSSTPSVPLEIVQDNEPPSLFIDLPIANETHITETVDVAGRVGDMLSGFMGLHVTVNGLPANVAVGIGNNGTFERMGIPLVLGTNTITVTATDIAGNTATTEVKVRRVQPVGLRMIVVSGNAQMTNIHRRLEQAVVVQITESNGVPLANKLVNFDVIRSDGRLVTDPETIVGIMKAQVRTDPSGYAYVWWTLGGDAGCGNNRVAASSRDIEGVVYFCASASPGPAAQINIGSGNNQRAEVNGPAPEALRAWVSDSCNGIEGVPVTFTVLQGGGRLFPSPGGEGQGEGGPSITIPTTRTGHASVNYVLGPDAGNQIIEANFPGNRNGPATFVLFGLERDTNRPTMFTGLVLDNASKPIGGALCRLFYSTPTGRAPLVSTRSDAQGQFAFTNPPPGAADLNVLGSFATTLAGQPIPIGSFPSLSYDVVIVPNADNSLPAPVLLPRLNTNNARIYYGTNDLVLTCEGMAGLKMTIKANSMRDPQGNPVTPDRPTLVSLNQVHHDDVPMPLPDGAAPPFAWTLQPGGATFNPPIQIEYPNMSGLPPGAVAYFLSFNHDTGRFEIISSGHVVEDGSIIVTDPGGGLGLAGWGCNCPPYAVTGDCESCVNECIETGSLSGGSITAARQEVGLCEEIVFTISNVTDSGGSLEKKCKKAGNSTVSVTPGQITYAWKITRNGATVTSGSGATARAVADHQGKYKCEFTASVDRECAPESIMLDSNEVEVEQGIFADATISLAVTAPPQLKQKINQAINKIPGVNVELEEVSGSYTSKSRPCCKNGAIQEDGERYKEGSMTLSASLKGITIWGPPTISRQFDFTFAIISIDFNVGVKLDSDFSITGTVGKRWDDCVPEECLYGSFGGEVSLTPKVQIEAIACLETFWTSEKCVGVDITPLSFPIKVGGSVGYNSKQACNGLTGEFNLFSIDFKADFKVNGVGVEFNYPIYGGL